MAHLGGLDRRLNLSDNCMRRRKTSRLLKLLELNLKIQTTKNSVRLATEITETIYNLEESISNNTNDNDDYFHEDSCGFSVPLSPRESGIRRTESVSRSVTATVTIESHHKRES